jgi:hypothetical protein
VLAKMGAHIEKSVQMALVSGSGGPIVPSKLTVRIAVLLDTEARQTEIS